MPELKAEAEVEYYPAPVWLTNDYLQDKLRKYYKDDGINVLCSDIKPATAKGENFASVMTRIRVEFSNQKQEKKEASFLLKTNYEDEDPSAQFFNNFGVYTREMEAYEVILPKQFSLLREIGDTEKLFANTLCVDREHSSIFFEDLSLENYTTVDRIERINVEHAKLALRKLAKLHASAAVLNERSPGIFAKNNDCGLFNRQNNGFTPVMTGILRGLVHYVQKDPELRKKYYNKLLTLCDNIMEYGARVFDVKSSDFMTLTHGDYWTSNIMFKYDENGSPINVVPVDYQYSCWCSPAVDLHYFFNTSLREELRLHHQPELLQYYYQILVDTLKRLMYKAHIPSLFEFHLQFEARSFYALFASLIFQPLMMYSGKEEACFQNILLDTDAANRFKDSMYENETIQKNVQRLLPFFDRKGLLDVMH